MIQRVSKQFEGPKGVNKDVNLNDEIGVVIEKEGSSPQIDVTYDDDVNDANDVPTDPKEFSQTFYTTFVFLFKGWLRLSLICKLGSF